MKITIYLLLNLLLINLSAKTPYHLYSNNLSNEAPKEQFIAKDIKKIFNLRKVYNLGASLEIQLESINLNLDWFITEYVNLDLSIGKNIGLGIKLFLIPKNDLSPYVGISLLNNYDIKIPELYLPLGIQFMQNDGFTFSVECGLLLNEKHDFIGGLKMGYHF